MLIIIIDDDDDDRLNTCRGQKLGHLVYLPVVTYKTRIRKSRIIKQNKTSLRSFLPQILLILCEYTAAWPEK